MTQQKLEKQIEAINRAFHQVWFAVMFDRQDTKSENMQSLSFIDMHLIGIAEENPDYILKEIRDILKVPQTTLSSIVAKLEKLGFLRRVINHRDMRSFSIEVTEKGKKMHADHKANDRKKAAHLLGLLDADERDEFIRLFQKVADGLGRL
jgi:DNA-binding MarR family transcriptional regulator